MTLIHWYDWITPTNPYAAIFFGIIFTMIAVNTVWLDTKKSRNTVIAGITGLGVTMAGVWILNLIGFYG